MVEDQTFRDSTERKGMVSVKEQPMVAIGDLNICKEHFSRSVVFPPINHENLHVQRIRGKEHDDQSSISLSPPSSLGFPSSPSNSSISSTSSFSPSDVDELVPPVPVEARDQVRTREPSQVSWWWRIWLGVMQSKVAASVSSVGCKIASRGVFWSMFPAAVVAFWVAYVGFQLSRRRRRRERDDRLLLLVKEQDKKFADLLGQIAQMNNLLISRQRA